MRNVVMLLKEPSTYAGLAGILGALGIAGLSSSDWSTLIAVPMALAAAAAVFMRDPAHVTQDKPRPPR